MNFFFPSQLLLLSPPKMRTFRPLSRCILRLPFPNLISMTEECDKKGSEFLPFHTRKAYRGSRDRVVVSPNFEVNAEKYKKLALPQYVWKMLITALRSSVSGCLPVACSRTATLCLVRC